MNIYLKELLKLKIRLAYGAGWLIGIMKGTFGLTSIPTDEEVKALELYKKCLENFEKQLENLKE